MNSLVWVVEPMCEQDLASVLAIQSQLQLPQWNAGHFLSEINNPQNSLSLVGKIGNMVVAYAIFQTSADQSELCTIAVHPLWQRQGLARRLLGMALDLLRSRRVLHYFLEVRASNIAALQLYQSLGFSSIGVRKRYYSDGEDAVVMERIDG